MTRIIVASKEGLDVLQDGQLNKVVLNQPTIIQIGVSQKISHRWKSRVEV